MIVKQQSDILSLIEQCKHVDSELLESETVEFKEYESVKSLQNSKDLAEEISALSNKNGGIVVVGIRDGSNVINSIWETQLVGFEKGDVTEIEQRIKGKLKPTLDISAVYHEFEGKDYLVIHAPARRDTLIATTSGKVCIREGRSSRPMTPDEIRIAVSSLQNYDWTADIIEELDISCFDVNSLELAYNDYCKRKNSPPKRGLVRKLS